MGIIKLKHLLESIQLEAGFGGTSRSGQGIPNWEHHLVPDFDPNEIFYIEKDGPLYDQSFKEILKLTKGEPIKILDTKTVDIPKGKTVQRFAKIKTQGPSQAEGLININFIRKRAKETKNSNSGGGEATLTAVLGGKNSAEFKPDKLKLVGQSYESKEQLASALVNNIQAEYPEPVYDEIKKYLHKCIEVVSGVKVSAPTTAPLQEYAKDYAIQGEFKINPQDISTLSKNFGEALAALHSLSTNKKAKSVSFSTPNNPLWDYKINSERPLLFSTKSKQGSSTAMANLNLILDKFVSSDEETSKNPLVQNNKKEFSMIKRLMNKADERTTASNIEEFYNRDLPSKMNEIIDALNKITESKGGKKLNSISQKDLDEWFSFVCNNLDEKSFIDGMNNIYSNILKKSKTSGEVLSKMFKTKKSKLNGYIYYPMGSYIVKVLNDSKSAVNLLNSILNYGSFVYQVNVNMTVNSVKISIENFKNMSFKFSWNGLSNDPGNRPIGFKEAGGSEEES